MTMIGPDWRTIDGVATAWFDAPSAVAGAELTRRVVTLSDGVAVDVRATGVLVRPASGEHAAAVSSAARDLGLVADPSGLQQLGVVIEATDPSAAGSFWQRVLDYAPADDGLIDPWRRDPAVRIRRASESRPLRNRLHLDVVRPSDAIAGLDLGEASGPYGVCHTDPDGNEVDLVPGDPLGEGSEVADWQQVWSAMASYRTTSPAQQLTLVVAAAALADEVGFPWSIDVRPGLVVLDSGKDQWDGDAHGLGVDVTELAARLQAAARDLEATADPALPRVTQLFVDAADVIAVRAFWVAALGYVHDRRAGLTDIHDPRRLDPVLVFQQLDVSDTARRRQRNRIHVELAVPDDRAQARLAGAVGAGGRLVEETEGRLVVADPEGNELVIVSEG